jgi:hypothetical protein
MLLMSWHTHIVLASSQLKMVAQGHKSQQNQICIQLDKIRKTKVKLTKCHKLVLAV